MVFFVGAIMESPKKDEGFDSKSGCCGSGSLGSAGSSGSITSGSLGFCLLCVVSFNKFCTVLTANSSNRLFSFFCASGLGSGRAHRTSKISSWSSDWLSIASFANWAADSNLYVMNAHALP